MKFYYCILLLVASILFSCEEKKISETNLPNHQNLEDDKQLLRSIISVKSYKDQLGKNKIEEIKYSVGIVSALEFLKRKKQIVDPTDIKDLRSESVVIFDIELLNLRKKIFHSHRIILDKDHAIQYLIGNIINDFKVIQNDSIYIATAHQFENSLGKQNKIRLFIFFKGLNLEKYMRFNYNDKLFGGGLINFGLNREKNDTEN